MSEEFDRYFLKLQEFESLLSYGEKLINSLVGMKPSLTNDVYGERIFGKLLCHGFTLKKISPSKNPVEEKELWDISSSYAVSRALIETYDALAYIALPKVDKEEKEFRLLFWKLHAEARRLDMLTKIGSRDPRVEETKKAVGELRSQVISHSCFSACSKSVRSGITNQKYQPYHLTQRERNEESGINHEYSDAVKMHLSSHVHTHPFSVQQIIDFKAGSGECIGLMGISIQYSASFLSKAVEGMIALFPTASAKMDSKLTGVYEQWLQVAGTGIKHY